MNQLEFHLLIQDTDYFKLFLRMQNQRVLSYSSSMPVFFNKKGNQLDLKDSKRIPWEAKGIQGKAGQNFKKLKKAKKGNELRPAKGHNLKRGRESKKTNQKEKSKKPKEGVCERERERESATNTMSNPSSQPGLIPSSLFWMAWPYLPEARKSGKIEQRMLQSG